MQRLFLGTSQSAGKDASTDASQLDREAGTTPPMASGGVLGASGRPGSGGGKPEGGGGATSQAGDAGDGASGHGAAHDGGTLPVWCNQDYYSYSADPNDNCCYARGAPSMQYYCLRASGIVCDEMRTTTCKTDCCCTKGFPDSYVCPLQMVLRP
jgi:hypothetical protein